MNYGQTTSHPRLRAPALAFLVALAAPVGTLRAENQALAPDHPAGKVLDQYCLKCHGKKKPKGDLSLAKLGAVTAKNAKVWNKVLTQLAFGEMPPRKKPQPTEREAEVLARWIKSQLVAIGFESDIDHKILQPAYANLLSHERLFSETNKPAYSPPRLWRLHPRAYDVFLEGFGRELGKGGVLSKPFKVAEGKGVPSNYAGLVKADVATLSQLMLNCKQIAELQTVGFKRVEKDRRTKKVVERVYRKAPKTFEAIIDGESEPTEEQLRAAVVEEFEIVLRRKPSDQERTAFEALARKAIAIGGRARGLRTLAMAILLRPEAIYRMEVGLGKIDEHGRRMLSPYELAYSIAYALTDVSPDKLLLGPPKPRDRGKRPTPPSLLQVAESGKLSTREDVRRVVTQIWENEGIEKPRILRFFQEFFGYHKAGAVFKGDRGSRAFHARQIVKDADTLVMHIVNNDRDVLKELLTTDRFFFVWPGSDAEYKKRIEYISKRLEGKNPKERNYKYFITRTKETGKRPIPQANPTWRQTLLFYNIDPAEWSYPETHPFPMPAGQRCGILTHPAWLAAWSGNFGNDPIRRGKWIREHLLAGAIPDVPITVDASVPEDPHKTLRQRLEKTRDDYCWKCHSKMEPLGLPFESYTDFGRYRNEEGLGPTKALGKPKNRAPVDTRGEVIDSGEDELDGKVKDVSELMHRLAGSTRVRQSFVRHAFRYWLGRNEMLQDAPTLIKADGAYAAGGSFKAMVLDLLSSDSFLYRK
jgi:hypothetical protein